MMHRPPMDELAAVRGGHTTEPQHIPWHGDMKFGEDTDAQFWSYTFDWPGGRTETGFLLCWPSGTRLHCTTHRNGKFVGPIYHSWWLDPAWQIGQDEPMVA